MTEQPRTITVLVRRERRRSGCLKWLVLGLIAVLVIGVILYLIAATPGVSPFISGTF